VKSNSNLIVIILACLAIGAVGYWYYTTQYSRTASVNLGGASITVQTPR
jgi:uncharacterized membrane protein YpjA